MSLDALLQLDMTQMQEEEEEEEEEAEEECPARVLSSKA